MVHRVAARQRLIHFADEDEKCLNRLNAVLHLKVLFRWISIAAIVLNPWWSSDVQSVVFEHFLGVEHYGEPLTPHDENALNRKLAKMMDDTDLSSFEFLVGVWHCLLHLKVGDDDMLGLTKKRFALEDAQRYAELGESTFRGWHFSMSTPRHSSCP